MSAVGKVVDAPEKKTELILLTVSYKKNLR